MLPLQAIQKRLIGIPVEENSGMIMLATPIRSVFESISNFAINRCANGWWPISIGSEWMCTLVPQGTQSLDLLHAMPGDCLYIHIGFAGATNLGLTNGLNLGSIVGIRRAACYPEGYAQQAGILLPELAQCTAISFPTFHDSDKAADIVGGEYDCCDMECGFVFREAELTGKRAGCIQLISDSIDEPWYKAEPVSCDLIQRLAEITISCVEHSHYEIS